MLWFGATDEYRAVLLLICLIQWLGTVILCCVGFLKGGGVAGFMRLCKFVKSRCSNVHCAHTHTKAHMRAQSVKCRHADKALYALWRVSTVEIFKPDDIRAVSRRSGRFWIGDAAALYFFFLSTEPPRLIISDDLKYTHSYIEPWL